jgi:c-di-GMP-binding flagellar brake protein YcgR
MSSSSYAPPLGKRLNIRVDIASYAGMLHAPEGTRADLIDISLGGIGFVSDLALTPASDIYVSFTLPDLNGAPFVFHVKGNLIHSTYVERHGGFLNGFEFLFLTETQDTVLRHYITLLIAKASEVE